MPGKRPASKTAKNRKAVSRPPVRKAAARKSAPRAKTATHSRKSGVASASRKPRAARQAAPARPAAAAVAETPRTKPTPPPAPPQKSAGSLGRTAMAVRAVEAEEAEGAEPGSLLAGPRNVQPYVVKRGELYMSKEQLEHFRMILQNWKRDLMVEVDRTVSHMKDEAANFPDPNDRATQEEEFSLELRTRDRERKLIRKIDEALKRIDDGTEGE
jgi:DnaK suppressor protein